MYIYILCIYIYMHIIYIYIYGKTHIFRDQNSPKPEKAEAGTEGEAEISHLSGTVNIPTSTVTGEADVFPQSV